MTREEADRELGRIVREAVARGLQDGKGREIDVALDAGGRVVLATIRIDVQGRCG